MGDRYSVFSLIKHGTMASFLATEPNSVRNNRRSTLPVNTVRFDDTETIELVSQSEAVSSSEPQINFSG